MPRSRRNRNRRRALESAASFPASRRAAATRRRNCWKSGPGRAARSVSGDSSPCTSASRSRSIRRWRAASRRPGLRTVSSACAMGPESPSRSRRRCSGSAAAGPRARDRARRRPRLRDPATWGYARGRSRPERSGTRRAPAARALPACAATSTCGSRRSRSCACASSIARRRHHQPVFPSATSDLEIAMRAARGIRHPGPSGDLR